MLRSLPALLCFLIFATTSRAGSVKYQMNCDLSTGHDEDGNVNAALFGAIERKSKPLRICLTSAHAQEGETYTSYAFQQEPGGLGEVPVR
jgi:hypothetical protein